MKRNNVRATGRERSQRSLDYLRKRSQHRVWWNCARVALRRGQSGEPLYQPTGHCAIGKRV
jgi:hypothetical protein